MSKTELLKEKVRNERILVISDTHYPYEDKRSWDFLELMKYKHNPDRVVHTGDVVDFYNASRFPKDPDHPESFVNEMKKMRKRVRRLGKLFPVMDVTIGNHDQRLMLKCRGSGLPLSMMKPLEELLAAPEGWKFHEEEMKLIVESTGERIIFAHNLGVNPFLVAQRRGCSVLTGHQHSKGGVNAYNNGEAIYFGCNVPNLISNTGAPFSYTKISQIMPVRGCIIIKSGVPNLEILR